MRQRQMQIEMPEPHEGRHLQTTPQHSRVRDSMAITTPYDGGGHGNLLSTTSNTLLQMTALARENEYKPDIRGFYSHIESYCLRLKDHAMRAPQLSSQLNDELINRILGHLASLIRGEALQQPPLYDSIEYRLGYLNLTWNEARKQDKVLRLKFVRQSLNLELSKQQQDGMDKTLGLCIDELERQEPEIVATECWRNGSCPDPGEPSYAVGKASQSIFDALLSCKGCSCPHQHDFKAKLELGTYRRPEKVAEKKYVDKLKCRVGKRRGEDSQVGQIDFDMFLSMEHDWSEIRVQTIKEKGVSFQLEDELALACLSETADGHAKLEKLCQPMFAAKSKPWQRLLLKLSSGNLFHMGSQKTNFEIDRRTEPISLAQCLEQPEGFFPDKTRRILSLIVGYTVFHLQGTSWLQPGWGSANIKFFKTKSKTPMRPYIQTQLPSSHCDDLAPQIGIVVGDGEYDNDDLYSEHPCPELVSLAVLLMEIHFQKSFKNLAEEHDIELIDDPNGRIAPIDVDQVFYGDKEDNKEEWRCHIAEDYSLRAAIDNCLDTQLWEDENGQALDSGGLRSRIYQKVVRPLECHLHHGFGSQIPLDDLDRYARGLNFGHWGSVISSQSCHSQEAALFSGRPTLDRTRSPIRNTSGASSRRESPMPSMYPEGFRQCHHINQYWGSNAELLSDSKLGSDNLQFFDDEEGDIKHHSNEASKYREWKSEYKKVYEKYIEQFLTNSPSVSVKIAILDTGIDRDHYAFEAREESIKGRRNFYNESQKNVPDNNGHGTFTASLILDYAPDAALYIAKIADWENTTPDAKIVANAINYAVETWDVDIISMSFGWPSCDFNNYSILQEAIDNANAKKVLMFAAAANSGGRRGRAYPASASEVICVYSTDTNGNRSNFSPTAEDHNTNIATVGESIESAWPTLLCRDRDNPTSVKTRSGTSYATPIIAGIAAFQLQYARLHMSESAAMLKRKDKMEALLRRCAERGRNYIPRDGYYYVQLSLHSLNLYSGEVNEINHRIREVLKM